MSKTRGPVCPYYYQCTNRITRSLPPRTKRFKNRKELKIGTIMYTPKKQSFKITAIGKDKLLYINISRQESKQCEHELYISYALAKYYKE